jgi:hypothetical protein
VSTMHTASSYQIEMVSDELVSMQIICHCVLFVCTRYFLWYFSVCDLIVVCCLLGVVLVSNSIFFNFLSFILMRVCSLLLL